MKLLPTRRRGKTSSKRTPFVGPAPVEQAYRIQRGGTFVVLELSGPCGQWIAFLPPEDARAIAKDLDQAAGDVASGLDVVRDDKQLEVVTRTGGKR